MATQIRDTKDFRSNVDFKKNQIFNFVIHKSATELLNGVEGQVYYNTKDDLIYYHDGTKWISVASKFTITDENNNGLIITNTDGDYRIKVNVDNASVGIKDDKVEVKDSGITTVKVKDKAILFSKIQDIPTMTVIGNLDTATSSPKSIKVLSAEDLSGATHKDIPTSQAVKAYVDSRVTALGTLIGSWDASANNTFPVRGVGEGATTKGDYWYVSVAGTILGERFQVGDVIVANKNNPSASTASNYIFLQTNADQATTTVMGMVMLATSTDVGTKDDTKAVTSKVMVEYIESLDIITSSISELWTSGSTKTMAGSFASKNISVEVYSEPSGESVIVPYKVHNVEGSTTKWTVTLFSNPAPSASDTLRVVMFK